MRDNELALLGHLFRRAGFGSTQSELEKYRVNGYETAVENLLHPSDDNGMSEYLIRRYHPDESELRIVDSIGAFWIYRMCTTKNPLVEKMALFWHSLFATGEGKVFQGKTLTSQIDMFRHEGLGNFETLLVQISRDPAMLFWLDNNDNHKGAVNENYGRELLELFSMAVGNYTEQDIKEASRAFTGWTIQNTEYMALRVNNASIWPYGKIGWQFEYRDKDHDKGEKLFLGEEGDFDGEDIIAIIVRQPATARFLSTRLYQFFVKQEIDTKARVLIDDMVESYFTSNYQIKPILRTMFNSKHFKSKAVRFAQYKSPIELVVGTLKLSGAVFWPGMETREAALAGADMGQEILNPPSVEGWHEGQEWIDSGALVERVNFSSRYLGDSNQPGVQAIINRLAESSRDKPHPRDIVIECLNLLGAIEVRDETLDALVTRFVEQSDLDFENGNGESSVSNRISDLIRMVSSSREYQLA